MNPRAPHLQSEVLEAAAAVARQASAIEAPLAHLMKRIAARPPRLIVTCARGSSGHAAIYAKHMIERHLGLPVAAAALNIATVYRRMLALDGQLFVAISQSGRSDDLIETAALARKAGAVTVALINAADSPLAQACEFVLPLAAGQERSIAATKSFVASLAAILRMVAAWSRDAALELAAERLPARLAQATRLDWSEALAPLASATSLVTLGRGPTLAIAREAALKLKEACALHAEAFSAAEFHHGPMALVSPDYPILAFHPGGEAASGFADAIADMRDKGARVFAAEPGAPQAFRLPALEPEHADADAICLIQSFYGFLVRLAARRGIDADRPPHLQKVTRTR